MEERQDRINPATQSRSGDEKNMEGKAHICILCGCPLLIQDNYYFYFGEQSEQHTW